MANLSNINNKFVVEQTTGFVGIGTTDPNFLIEAAGTNAELALNASSIYRLRSTSSDEFIITKNGVGDRLTIASGGNATFSAKVFSTSTVSGDTGTTLVTKDYVDSGDGSSINTILITVAAVGGGNRYFLDGVQQANAVLQPGFTYRFDQSNATNNGHPLRFSTNNNNSPAAPYTTGVTAVGTPGSSGAYTQIITTQATPVTLYYYCTIHSGMGGAATIRIIQTDGTGYFAGNVLIGIDTISPALGSFAQLEVSDGTKGGIIINTQTAGANNYSRLMFSINNNINGHEGLIRYNTSDYHMAFYTDAQERMRIKSNGNIDITGNVDVYQTGASQLQVESLNSDANIIINSGADGVGGANREEGFIRFFQSNNNFFTLGKRDNGQFVLLDHTAGQDVVTFQDNGGIFFNPANNMMGINPVSFQPYWDGYSVFKVGADNSIFSNNATGSGSAIFMGQNIYNDGSNYRYTGAASNEAGLIDMRSGLFRFYNAPNGSANTVATMSQRLTVGLNGNVGIGTGNDPTELLEIKGASGLDGATPPTIKIQSSSAGTWTDNAVFAKLAFGNDDTAGGIACSINAYVDSTTGNNAGLSFFTSPSANTPTERMRISQAGEVNIGGFGGQFPILKVQGLAGGVHTGSTWAISANQDGIGRTILATGGQARAMYFENDGKTVHTQLSFFDSGIKVDMNSSTTFTGEFINTNASSYGLGIRSNSGFQVFFYDTGGNIGSITSNGSNTSYNTSGSDERLKENIEVWDENVLDKFKNLQPKTFKFIKHKQNDKTIKGYIAQNEVDNFPEAYPMVYDIDAKEDMYQFNPSGMTVYLMKAIQELKAEIEILKNK